MASTIERKTFSEVPLDDPFFNSLKQDYKEFPVWYKGKANEPVYVQTTDGSLTGLLYVKTEHGIVDDIIPPLTGEVHVKIGTLKVDAHGTRLGERLLKKAFDFAVTNEADDIYITVFDKHGALIEMLKEFGFRVHGTKSTQNGVEAAFVKSIKNAQITGNLREDYPLINLPGKSQYLLAIMPKWHSELFPDSILNTETYDVLSDVSHTNSISKMYICSMDGVDNLKPGDLLVIYRMSDGQGSAEYRSVATSVCTVERLWRKNDFSGISEFLQLTGPYSVFSESELRKWWNRSVLYVIQMLYSAAFSKRITRRSLAEDIGLDRNERWGFLPLSQPGFLRILKLGGIDERIVIG